MKKKWKIFWIVSIILLMIGIGLCVAGFALGATWNMVQFNIPDWISIGRSNEVTLDVGTMKEKASSEDVFYGIHSLEVEAEAANLQLLMSDEADTVKVKLEDEDMNRFLKCYDDRGELYIKTDHKFDLDQDLGTIWVYIPQSLMREIDIDVNAGTIYVEEINANSITLNIDAGEAMIQKFMADEAEFECGAGRIEAYGNVGKEIDVTCGAGEIFLNIDGHKEEYNYEIECGIGEVIVGDETHSGIKNIEKYSHNASKEMNIECGIGRISVEFKSN